MIIFKNLLRFSPMKLISDELNVPFPQNCRSPFSPDADINVDYTVLYQDKELYFGC